MRAGWTGGTSRTTESTAASTSSLRLATGTTDSTQNTAHEDKLVQHSLCSLSMCLCSHTHTHTCLCSSPVSLRPLDVEFMKALHEKVNIVPVLAKADSLTHSEICRKKKKVWDHKHTHRHTHKHTHTTALTRVKPHVLCYISCQKCTLRSNSAI